MKKNITARIMTFIAFLLMVSGLLLILFSTVPRLKEFIHYKNQEILYNTLTKPAAPTKMPPKAFSTLITSSSTMLNVTRSTRVKSPSPAINDKFTSLLKENPEVIGWITIQDTSINYPLVQHEDNQYYLTHDSQLSPSIYGSIYIDHRNNDNLDNKNTLIYGHNMNDHTMFHDLVNFKDQDFFEKHPYIRVSNLYEDFTYEIFAVYVVDADKETIHIDYENDTAFLAYISSCQSRSLFTRGMSFNSNDQIITLVTCSYELENARTIVQAKRVATYQK